MAKPAKTTDTEAPADAAVPAAPAGVRYQVVARAFVNGSLIEPQGRKDVYVFAAPGLEGPALKLAPEPAAEDAGDQHSGAGPSSL